MTEPKGCPTPGACSCPSAPEGRGEGEWQPISTAPKDGTPITVLYESGETEDRVYWQVEGRCCILGSRAGSYPPGWTSADAGHLPVDGVTHWQPTALATPSEESK